MPIRIDKPFVFSLQSSRLCRYQVYWPIVTLPLILGSTRASLQNLTASVFLASFALLLLTSGKSRNENHEVRSFKKRFSSLSAPCFLLLPIVIYPFLQAIPLPLQLVSFLSPQRATWLQRSMEATGWSHWWGSLSYVPLDSIASGLWFLTLLLFAFLLNRCLHEGAIRVGGLLAVLFLIAGFEALYGLIQVQIPSIGFGLHPGCATGTFPNRDHYAAFLGMIWPLQLVWLMRSLSKDADSGLRTPGCVAESLEEKERRRRAKEKWIFFVFLTGLVLLGLVFSKSRGGIISLAIGTTVLAFLGRKRSRMIGGLLIGCWVVILVFGSMIGFESIIKRFTEIVQDAPGRFQIWKSAWSIICDHWLTGTGAGTFKSVIFLYQIFEADQLQDGAAHNDYLQVTSEWGVPISLLIFCLVWGYWLLAAGREAIKSSGKESSEEREDRLVRIGAIAGSAAFLSHIWVEFNWQIPANQLYFVMLLVLINYGRSRIPNHKRRADETALPLKREGMQSHEDLISGNPQKTPYYVKD